MKYTATKAHLAGAVTAVLTAVISYVTMGEVPDAEGLGPHLAVLFQSGLVGAGGWLATYFGTNKPKDGPTANPYSTVRCHALPLVLVAAAMFLSGCDTVGDRGTKVLGSAPEPSNAEEGIVQDTRGPGVSIDLDMAEALMLIALTEIELRYPVVAAIRAGMADPGDVLPESVLFRAERYCGHLGLLADTIVVRHPGYRDVTGADVNAFCDAVLRPRAASPVAPVSTPLPPEKPGLVV